MKSKRDFRAFLKSIGVEPKCFIPIAAKHGDNIAARSAKMPWWHGPTVLEALDQFQPADPPTRAAVAVSHPGCLSL